MPKFKTKFTEPNTTDERLDGTACICTVFHTSQVHINASVPVSTRLGTNEIAFCLGEGFVKKRTIVIDLQCLNMLITVLFVIIFTRNRDLYLTLICSVNILFENWLQLKVLSIIYHQNRGSGKDRMSHFNI